MPAGPLAHICFLVRDLDKALEDWKAILAELDPAQLEQPIVMVERWEAGEDVMSSATFVFYNFVGAAAWVIVCVGAGIVFGQVPFVKNNFSVVTIGIVVVSILPIVFQILKHRLNRSNA